MVEKVFPATDAALADALAFVEEELEKADCPMKLVMSITVCVEEMFVNVAHYSGSGTVTLRTDCVEGLFSITLVDGGVPFDPLAKPDPDITLSAEERRIGGLGIFMVKKSMDDVTYERKDGKNIFTMKKRIG